MKVIQHACIWDARTDAAAGHCAFGDLLFWQGVWLAVFREGSAHVSDEAGIRLLYRRASDAHWQDGGCWLQPNRDLRDPHFCVMPEHHICVVVAAVDRSLTPAELETFIVSLQPPMQPNWIWPPSDVPRQIADSGQWLWRLVGHGDAAYGFSYGSAGLCWCRVSADWETTVMPLEKFAGQQVNETGLSFAPDGKAYALLRRDWPRTSALVQAESGQVSTESRLEWSAPGYGRLPPAYFGTALPPYTDWDWQPFAERLGGPCLIGNASGDGFWAGYRRYASPDAWEPQWTEVAALDQTGQVLRSVRLPSGGDCSYPGMVLQDRLLHCLYYSSHEEARGTSMYLAIIDCGAELYSNQ